MWDWHWASHSPWRNSWVSHMAAGCSTNLLQQQAGTDFHTAQG